MPQLAKPEYSWRARVSPDLDSQGQTIDILAGMNIDHAGDGVGAVNRAGAVLQHFHTADNADRNGVEIDEIANSARADAVDPAMAVHQHQSAVGVAVGVGQIAQRNRAAAEGCALGAVGIIADAGIGHLLQNVADGGGRRGFNVLGGQGGKGADGIGVFARDPGARHHDRFGHVGGSVLGARGRDHRRRDGEGTGKQRRQRRAEFQALQNSHVDNPLESNNALAKIAAAIPPLIDLVSSKL